MPEDLGLVDSLVQSSFLVQGIMRRVAARHDLSVVQMRLLGILRDREPGILVLARHLELDKSSVTGLVDRAERRGLVARDRPADNRRVVRVGITAAGASSSIRISCSARPSVSTKRRENCMRSRDR